jgi:hypothetical protein
MLLWWTRTYRKMDLVAKYLEPTTESRTITMIEGWGRSASLAMRITYLLASVAYVSGIRRLPNANESPNHGRRLTFDDDHAAPLPQQTPRSAAEYDNPDAHLVASMPLLPDGLFPTRHWSGHLAAKDDGSDKKLFYWLFEPGDAGAGDDVPLILWLNGGPGCSSMDGLWLENGPFRLRSGNDGWTIDVNEYSWHNAPAWTLYVDQPVG